MTSGADKGRRHHEALQNIIREKDKEVQSYIMTIALLKKENSKFKSKG